jgi:chromosome segregation ATPase
MSEEELIEELSSLFNDIENDERYTDTIYRNIINLQQANKQLTEELETLKDDFDFNLGAIENIRKENHKLEDTIDKAIDYIKTTDKWLCRVNDNLCVEAIGKDKLLEILGEKENE